jgi:hypothetical protein
LGVGTYTNLLYEGPIECSPRPGAHSCTRSIAAFDLEERIATLAADRAVLLVVNDIDRYFEVMDRGAQGQFPRFTNPNDERSCGVASTAARDFRYVSYLMFRFVFISRNKYVYDCAMTR